MKIDIRYIVRDHIRTLRDDGRGTTSKFDILLFYIFPIAVSAWAYVCKVSFAKSDVYNVSITFFGIFIALLLNLQVAIFAILQRRWEPSADERMQSHQDNRREIRQSLMSELNANLSYLILVCCVALFAALIFYVEEDLHGFGPAATIFLYTHFLFTLVMIVKRAHALFQSEYGEQTGK